MVFYTFISLYFNVSDKYPTVDTMKRHLVFSVTFSLHKVLVASVSQELKSKINIKEESEFSLDFGFHLKIVEKMVGGILSRDRLWLKDLLVWCYFLLIHYFNLVFICSVLFESSYLSASLKSSLLIFAREFLIAADKMLEGFEDIPKLIYSQSGTVLCETGWPPC